MGFYEWVFSGIGVALLSGVLGFFIYRRKRSGDSVNTLVGQFGGIEAHRDVSITISGSGNVATQAKPAQAGNLSDRDYRTVFFCLYDGRGPSYSPRNRAKGGTRVSLDISAKALTAPITLKTAFGIDVDSSVSVELLHIERERFLGTEETLRSAKVEDSHTLAIVIHRQDMTANMLTKIFSLES